MQLQSNTDHKSVWPRAMLRAISRDHVLLPDYIPASHEADLLLLFHSSLRRKSQPYYLPVSSVHKDVPPITDIQQQRQDEPKGELCQSTLTAGHLFFDHIRSDRARHCLGDP